jgi:hypothetical protein
MKPHIYLKHAWWDCGWKYEQWCCAEKFGIGPSGTLYMRSPQGLGATPAAAYADWKRQIK